jgi:uncharacterized OB-fold protein
MSRSSIFVSARAVGKRVCDAASRVESSDKHAKLRDYRCVGQQRCAQSCGGGAPPTSAAPNENSNTRHLRVDSTDNGKLVALTFVEPRDVRC